MLNRGVCKVNTLAALGCGKGGTTIDEDLTEAAGGPLGAKDEEDEDLCGNGIVDEDEDEECDGDKIGRATCQSLGFSGGGVLSCDPETCIFDVSMCKLGMTTTGNGGTGGGMPSLGGAGG